MNAQPGDRLPVLRKHMTQEVIDAWAGVSGDYNPLHTDPTFAATSRFGGTIAHGHLPLAWFCELLIGWAGVSWLSDGELADVRFVAPVRPGADYEVSGTVTGTEGERAMIDVEVTGPDGTCVRGGAVAPIIGPRQRKGEAP
jgi:acyl dehydratase